VVIFNVDRGIWITGFQPERGLAYVEDQIGFLGALPTMTQDKQQHYLGWVHRELDHLCTLDAQGGLQALEPEDRVGLRLEWHDVVDRYLAVVAAYDDGRLPADLQSDLIELSVRLAELAPTLERLRLRQPDPKTLARLRLAAAS
jgi:hypothetical protein